MKLCLKGDTLEFLKTSSILTKAYRNYFQTYLERDLRQLIQVKDLTQFQRFVRLCAGRIGQVLNFESLGNDAGISSHTAKEWLLIMEASFIVFRLHPFYENFGKRIIKSSKLYFSDVGLACYLLGIENLIQLSRDPLRGNLVENLVVLELQKTRLNQGRDPQLFFFRDVQGHEVDSILQSGHQLIPIEIKAGQTFNTNFLKNLLFFKKVAEKRYNQGYVIYAGTTEQKIGDVQILNYLHSSQIIDKQLSKD